MDFFLYLGLSIGRSILQLLTIIWTIYLGFIKAIFFDKDESFYNDNKESIWLYVVGVLILVTVLVLVALVKFPGAIIQTIELFKTVIKKNQKKETIKKKPMKRQK